MIGLLGPHAPLHLVVMAELLENFFRYVLVAGAAFSVFWWWGRERFRSRLVQGKFARWSEMRREIAYSMSTVVVFTLTGMVMYYGTVWGVLRVYLDIGRHGPLYLVGSVVALIVAHDAYFYWTHRAMHLPWLYRNVHRVHHLSTNPSPWAAYAFSPLEAVVHALFVPLAAWLVPLHPIALVVFITFMIVRNVLGHLSIELYPRWFVRHRFWRWHTTTTHHNLHHRRSRCHYALYFTWWDHLMGTTYRDYETTFESVADSSCRG